MPAFRYEAVDTLGATRKGVLNADSARLKANQPARLRIEGIGDRIFEGEVERISPIAAEGTRTILLTVAISGAAAVLFPVRQEENENDA